MSQMGVFLQLACIVLLILGHGNSEDIRISVELSRRDDGEVGASLYVANATRELFKNSSLFLDFHAFTDQTHKLIAASGYVKDTNRNEAIELTCDATSKEDEIKECQLSKQREASVREEEIKNLKLLLEERMSAHIEEIRNLKLFHEKEISVRDEEIKELRSCISDKKGELLLRIISGDDKGYEKKIFRKNRTKVADLVIVDGHSYTKFSENMTKIPAITKQGCNFFVSDDGKVYEGIGWNVYNYYYNGGLGSKSLIIGFIKKDRDSLPSFAALETFRKLVRRAICSNVLSPHYSVIPFYLIIDRFNITDKSFERNGMTEWVGYRNNLDFMFPSDEKRAQPIVSKLEWSGTEEIGKFIISTPIEYLLVSDFDERCFFSCANYLKTMNKFEYLVGINFFLAEDGRAYEVQGWERTRNRGLLIMKGAIVEFMGAFHNYAPNKRIFDAFEGLIEEGLRLGKLSPTFKIVPIEKFDSSRWRGIGKYLKEEIRKHPRFSETW